jgi:hypothetical protein
LARSGFTQWRAAAVAAVVLLLVLLLLHQVGRRAGDEDFNVPEAASTTYM